MATARHGAGPGAVARAYASQVHPVFMLPPVAAAWFGATLGPTLALGPLLAVSVAAFFAVYTAHVKDGYVDFHVRGEDADHPLTARGCRLGLVAATGGFAAALAAVLALSGPVSALVLAPAWLLGWLHAPTLDTHPVGATAGYPLGIGLLIVAGHHAQAAAFAPDVLAFALVFVVVLCGVKVVDDATDHDYDRSIDKRTVAVVLGPARARRLARGLIGAGLFLVVALAVDGLAPPSAALATLPLVVVGLYARRAGPELATMLLVRGVYLLLAGFVVATSVRPLAGVPLPRISVLGPYTYLATEVVFGAAALALLVRADALRRAARTVVALYPVAYLWDWYTLEVGVFAIPLRTGVELLGIPLEEHLFMLVVPALVVGVHEMVNGERAAERRREPDGS